MIKSLCLFYYNNDNHLKNKIASLQKLLSKSLINKEDNITKPNKLNNEMTLIYQIEKNQEKIKLFHSFFVQNNKNRCFLLINNKYSFSF